MNMKKGRMNRGNGCGELAPSQCGTGTGLATLLMCAE
jgi:hypothetical protein